MDDRLLDELGAAWRKGWQPRDLVWVISRGLNSAAGALLVVAVLAESERYDGQYLDPRWQRQLEVLKGERPQALAQDRDAATLLAFVRLLPSVPILIPPPGDHSGGHVVAASNGSALDDRILGRVRALLAKAESTTFPDEAEALSAKAHELMARHAIDQVLLSVGSSQGEPEARRIHIENPYLSPKVMLLSAVAKANRCRVVWHKAFRMATVFGYPSDLEMTEVLFTSLLVQATSAMLAERPEVPWEIRSFRNAFLISYSQRIGERLEAINAEAVSAADTGSLLPALASRSDAVDAATDAAFPQLSPLRVSPSNAGGLRAGRAAADRADLQRRRVGGTTGLLDRT